MVKIYVLLSLLALPIAPANYSPADVAGHNSAASCWLIIDGEVYDVTKYLKRHEDFEYDIARHCGTDATALWRKKPGTGGEHSRKAQRLLGPYRIGKLGK